MIKLKEILLENTAPDIFVPRRMDDRLERMISVYIRNGSKGGLNLANKNLTVLPAILKDITVNGYFDCSGNLLTELPSILKDIDVEKFFNCANNKLTSLNNSPKTVGGSFYCGHNQLISLKGAPTYVGNNFVCSNNLLTSLEGVPKFVGENFICRFNSVKFTEEQVRAVCEVKGHIFV